jgi:hypothetical protein
MGAVGGRSISRPEFLSRSEYRGSVSRWGWVSPTFSLLIKQRYLHHAYDPVGAIVKSPDQVETRFDDGIDGVG